MTSSRDMPGCTTVKAQPARSNTATAMLETVLTVFMAHLLLLNPDQFDPVRIGMFPAGIPEPKLKLAVACNFALGLPGTFRPASPKPARKVRCRSPCRNRAIGTRFGAPAQDALCIAPDDLSAAEGDPVVGP